MLLSVTFRQSAGCTVTAHQLNAFPMKLIPNQLELLADASLRAVRHRTLLGQRLHPVGRPFSASLPRSSIPENLEARGGVQLKTCVACRVSKARLVIRARQGSMKDQSRHLTQGFSLSCEFINCCGATEEKIC